MKVIPEHLRDQLKTTPIGTLVSHTKDISLHLRTNDLVVSVGDKISYSLLEASIPVHMIIVDYIHKRKPIALKQQNLLKQFGEITYTVTNPAGCITDELWETIKTGLADMCSKTVRIDVHGEEDLASLVVISLAGSNVTVIYGVPDKGVLIVPITKHHKQVVDKVLEQM